MQRDLMENLPKYVLTATLLASAASFIHEFGFYHSLGLQLHEIPFSAADQIKLWLILIPAFIGLLSLTSLIQIVFFTVIEDKQRYTEYQKNKSQWSRITPKTRFWIVFLFVVSVFAFFATTSIAVVLATLWLSVGLYIWYEPLVKTSTVRSKYWYYLYTPFFIFALFYIGEVSAKNRLKKAPLAEIYKKSADNKIDIHRGKILRTYEKFVLTSDENGSYSLQALTDISSIKIPATKQDLNYMCRQFKYFCE